MWQFHYSRKMKDYIFCRPRKTVKAARNTLKKNELKGKLTGIFKKEITTTLYYSKIPL